MTFQRFVALLTVFTFLAPAMPAVGQAIPVHVDATVGLDEPTRELIDRLPKDIHVELIAALKEALPILQKSVDEYLAKVNDTLDHQINHAQCALTGVIAEANRRIKNLPKTRDKGHLELFDDFEKSELGRIKQSSDAAFYARVYGDTFNEATVTYCAMEFSGAAINIRPDENKYRSLNYMWLRLKGTCDNASDCVKKQIEVTKHLIETSDTRDVQFVRASQKLETVPKPADPSYLTSLLISFDLTSFDHKPYENTLFQLVGIQDQVLLARVRRSAQLVGAVPGKLSAIDEEIAKANVALLPIQEFGCGHFISPVQVSNAQAHADLTEAPRKEIEAALAEALTADEKNQGEAIKSIRADLALRRAAIETIRNATSKRWTYPNPCAMH